MKHIGWCLDKIQMALVHIPKAVISPEDKKKAGDILDEIQKHANTLEQLILNPSFKEYLHQLETASMERVRLQVHEIEELFKDLEHMLLVLDLYLKDLKGIIATNPEKWNKKADQLVLMIDQKFGGERGELRKEFQVALYAEKELKRIISSEEHLAEFLKI